MEGLSNGNNNTRAIYYYRSFTYGTWPSNNKYSARSQAICNASTGQHAKS